MSPVFPVKTRLEGNRGDQQQPESEGIRCSKALPRTLPHHCQIRNFLKFSRDIRRVEDRYPVKPTKPRPRGCCWAAFAQSVPIGDPAQADRLAGHPPCRTDPHSAASYTSPHQAPRGQGTRGLRAERLVLGQRARAPMPLSRWAFFSGRRAKVTVQATRQGGAAPALVGCRVRLDRPPPCSRVLGGCLRARVAAALPSCPHRQTDR